MLVAFICLFSLTGWAEKTKVIRVFNGDKVVGEFIAANVESVEIADAVPPLEINGHEYVDLGLPSGLKWATCNVGAELPNDCGDSFYWGNPEPKTSPGSSKVNGVDIEDYSGNPEYDAASAIWGSTWRTPTLEEAQELIDNCEWKYLNYDGVSGLKVIGPNGKSIFIPYNALGNETAKYWLSTPDVDNTKAYYLLEKKIYTMGRNSTYAIRPVSK